MRTMILKKARVLLLASVLTMAVSASAEIIYDNSVNDQSLRFAITNQIGDEIYLAGTQRALTNFSFEYWALNNGTTNGSFSGISVQVRFYLNDGPDFNGYATPGFMFYESAPFTFFDPTDRNVLNYDINDFGGSPLFIPMPAGVSNMTWSVQFSGMDGDDTVGLDIYYPPVVGSSPAQEANQMDDYWEFSGGSWALKTNIVNMSFAARFDATVPEPSTIVLGILGGLGLLVARGRLLKKKA